MRLTLVAAMSPKPGCAPELERTILGITEDTLAEPGCEEYALHRDAESGDLVMLERWSSAAAMEAHLARPHVRDALVAIVALCTSIRSWRCTPVPARRAERTPA